MDSSIEDILKRMGWATGLHLPVANDENKALQKDIERLMLKKAKTTQYYENEEARYNSIASHLKYVKQQNVENQNLLTTYRERLDTEENKFLTTQAEKDRILQEVRQIRKQEEDVQARILNKKNDLSRGMTKMEKMKSETSWDSEAMGAWEEALEKRDDDNELLRKFSREDEKKAKELEARRQALQMEVVERKKTLAKLLGDLTINEKVLERLGKAFKQQKDEKKALTIQWQAAMKNLKRRDGAIDQAAKDISFMQELLSEKQEQLDEQKSFLNNEIDNNKEFELSIQDLNLNASYLRKEQGELIQFVMTLGSEASTLKRSLISMANFLEKERRKSRNLTKEIDSKLCRVKLMETEVENLKTKLDNVKASSTSAAERAKQLEQMAEAAQRQEKVMNADIERMQGTLFRTQQSLNELKEIAKIKEIEITSCEASTNSMKKRTQQVYNDLQKQKEINYNLDFNINQMESRLDRLEGHTSDEDKQMREEKILELEKALAEENEVKQMLQGQVVQIEDEMRRLSNAIQADNAQLDTLKDKLQDEMLSFEGGVKQTAEVKQRSQQKQVDENVLRLRVNQLENIMKRENYSIYTMQKFRLELETAMKEQQIEISANKDILIAKRRNLEEEKGRLKRDIGSRNIKIEQLQKRYHLAIMALGKDESGQPLSVTHFKIKNAQEKYMLQQEGDELDAKVKRAEKEIIAMENTLKVVNSANSTYRQSLSAVEEFDEEAQEMQQLEAEINNIMTVIRSKRKNLISKKHDVQDLKESMHMVDVERDEVKEILATVENEYTDLQQYAVEQRVKIDRADRHLNSCMRNLDPRITEKYHKNLVIRQLQEANKSAFQQLTEALTRYPDMKPNIHRYLYVHELQLPGPRLEFTPSSSSVSTRSSEYYLGVPYMTNVLLTFDSTTKAENKAAPKKKITPKRSKF